MDDVEVEELEELEEQSPDSSRLEEDEEQSARERKLNTAAYVLQKFKESGKLYYRPDEWFPPDPKLLDQRNEKTVKLFKREEWADSALFDIVQQLFEDEEYYQQESKNNASFDYDTIQAHMRWAEYKKQKKMTDGYSKTVNRIKTGVEQHWNEVPRVKSNKDLAKRAEAVRKVAEQQREIIEKGKAYVVVRNNEASNKNRRVTPQWNNSSWQELFSKSMQQKRKERRDQEMHEAKVLDAQRRAQKRVTSTKKKEVKEKEQKETLEKDILNLRKLRISTGILESASRVHGYSREDFLQMQREMAQLPLEEREKYFHDWIKVFSENSNRNILGPELKITTVEEVDKIPHEQPSKKNVKNLKSFRPSSAPQTSTSKKKLERSKSTPSSPMMNQKRGTEIEIVISNHDDDEFEDRSQESEGFAPWNTTSPK